MLKLACLLVGVSAVFGLNYYDLPEETRIKMMGTRLDGKSNSQDHPTFKLEGDEAEAVLGSLPTSFEAGKDKWQQCANTIGYIKNQAACGSCWAVAASEVIEDRECIFCGAGVNASKNHQGPNEPAPGIAISAEQIMACCTSCGDGCQGGYIIDAMKYYCNTGVVTGAWYHSNCGCQSYQVDPSNHNELPTPSCKSTCDDPNYPDTFANDKHMGNSAHSVVGEAAMMQEIYTNGPIECGFTVKQSFETYFNAHPNGIYCGGGWFDRTLGGHAIKIVGWGEGKDDKGKTAKYWIINNSWGTSWANGGQFKFCRGKNLNGMESQCAAAIPKCGNKNPRANNLQCKGIDY